MSFDYVDDQTLDEIASRARARASTPTNAPSEITSGEYILQATDNGDDVHFLIDRLRAAQTLAKAGDIYRDLHVQATQETETHFNDAVALRQTNSELNTSLARVAGVRDELAALNRNLLRAVDLIAPSLPNIHEDDDPSETVTITAQLTKQQVRQIQMARDPGFYAPHRVAARANHEE